MYESQRVQRVDAVARSGYRFLRLDEADGAFYRRRGGVLILEVHLLAVGTCVAARTAMVYVYRPPMRVWLVPC